MSPDTIAAEAPAAAGACTVRVVGTVEELQRLRTFWEAGARQRDADPDFYFFDLVEGSKDTRPHVMLMERDGRPQAMLLGSIEKRPLEINFGSLGARLPWPKTLTFRGFVGGAGLDEARLLIAGILEALRSGAARVAVLESIEAGSLLHQAAGAVAGRWHANRFSTGETHWSRTLSGGTSVLAALSKKERYNQRRRGRQLRERFGEVRIERFTSAADVDRLVQDAEAVARRSYLRAMGRGFEATEIGRRKLELEAAKGTLQASILYLDSKPCSFWIGSLSHGVLHSEMLAFDPEYREFSPGAYLMLAVMEEIAKETPKGSAIVVDFGGGEQEYKWRWGDRQRQQVTVFLFAPGLRGLMLNAFRLGAAALFGGFRRAARRNKLIARLRRARAYRALSQ